MRRAAFHGIIGKVTGLHFQDLGCSARAFDRRVLEEISLYGDQHRFLPVLANRQGFRVTEVKVRQSHRDRFDGSYTPRVNSAVDHFHTTMGELQRATIEHVFEMRAVLSPQQRRKFDEIVRTELLRATEESQ